MSFPTNTLNQRVEHCRLRGDGHMLASRFSEAPTRDFQPEDKLPPSELDGEECAACAPGAAGAAGEVATAAGTEAAVEPQQLGGNALVEPLAAGASRKRPAESPAEGAPHSHASRLGGHDAASLAPPAAATSAGAAARAATPPAPYQGPKRVPAPGATAEAVARLARLGCTISGPPSGSQPISAPAPPLPPRRVPAPGATAIAVARLAALGASGAQQAQQQPALPAAGADVARRGGGGGSATPGPSAAEQYPLGTMQYPLGTVVWAKMASYPWWPAQVQRPSPDQQRLKHGPADVFVVFYGTADYTWLPVADVRAFLSESPEYSKFASVKNSKVQKAIDEAWVYIGRPRPDLLGKQG